MAGCGSLRWKAGDTGAQDVDTRRVAFFALAEADLTDFSSRLHRIAGDVDRRIRFATAVALVPSGEPWAVRLLVAEMDEERPAEVLAARRALDRLPSRQARRLLEEMVRDGTANPFAVDLLIDLPGVGKLDEPLRQRVWDTVSTRIDSSSYARLVASKLDSAEAARRVCTWFP